MKAVVFHGVGDIRLDSVRDPKIKAPTDALVRITASAICGTDLHFIRGTISGLEPGAILGHEAVGVIEEVGKDVRGKAGRPRGRAVDHLLRLLLVLPSRLPVAVRRRTKGPHAGTPYYGGGEQGGGFDGLQAEYAALRTLRLTSCAFPTA